MDAGGNDLSGWELNNPDQDVFDIQVMEVFGACVACDVVGECAMPCESVRRLVPKEGTIVGLGHEQEMGKPRRSYFALLNDNDVKFILLSTPEYLWATASYVSPDQVPEWALSQLSQARRDKMAV